MTEMPVLIIDVQRGGPSTGLRPRPSRPTSCRPCSAATANARWPSSLPVPPRIASPWCSRRSPGGRLHDAGVLALGRLYRQRAEPWLIPNVEALPKITVKHPTEPNTTATARRSSCRTKGTPGWCGSGDSRHPGPGACIGGLEKEDITGNVSYDPQNHEHMVKTRAQKIANIADEIPLLEVNGPAEGICW